MSEEKRTSMGARQRRGSSPDAAARHLGYLCTPESVSLFIKTGTGPYGFCLPLLEGDLRSKFSSISFILYVNSHIYLHVYISMYIHIYIYIYIYMCVPARFICGFIAVPFGAVTNITIVRGEKLDMVEKKNPPAHEGHIKYVLSINSHTVTIFGKTNLFHPARFELLFGAAVPFNMVRKQKICS